MKKLNIIGAILNLAAFLSFILFLIIMIAIGISSANLNTISASNLAAAGIVLILFFIVSFGLLIATTVISILGLKKSIKVKHNLSIVSHSVGIANSFLWFLALFVSQLFILVFILFIALTILYFVAASSAGKIQNQ